MRLILCVIAISFCSISTAMAQRYPAVEDAGDLHKLCNEKYMGNKAVCTGFIAGVFEVAANNSIDGIRSCIPLQSATNVAAVQKLAMKWIAAHPDKQIEPASRAIAQALAEAFPCNHSHAPSSPLGKTNKNVEPTASAHAE